MSPSTFRSLPEGIYTPVPTFFLPNEDLDLEALTAQVSYVASCGTIPVVVGSAGEAPHLTPAERSLVIKTTRKALDDAGLNDMPLVAGVGALSTRETIQLCHDAADAGADFGMVIPPGYYAGQLQGGPKGREALLKFFVDVAESSPLPVVLYNFPAVSGGIDLDSDLIVDVLKASANVVGVKLTCASVGKITRINAVVTSPEFLTQYPRKRPEDIFRIIDGFIDILLPSVASGAAGAISGLPNIAPRMTVKLWELGSFPSNSNEFREAQRLQGILALADGTCQKIGIAGLKMLVHKVRGHSALPRRPLLPMTDEQGDSLLEDKAIQEVLAVEAQLEKAV